MKMIGMVLAASIQLQLPLALHWNVSHDVQRMRAHRTKIASGSRTNSVCARWQSLFSLLQFLNCRYQFAS